MTLILFILFSLVIFGIVLISSLVRGIGSFIFGSRSTTQRNYSSYSDRSSNHYTDHTSKKVFLKDEGEYVKYEEIKD